MFQQDFCVTFPGRAIQPTRLLRRRLRVDDFENRSKAAGLNAFSNQSWPDRILRHTIVLMRVCKCSRDFVLYAIHFDPFAAVSLVCRLALMPISIVYALAASGKNCRKGSRFETPNSI